MNTDVKFKPEVSVDQALTCLAPLSDYFGWTKTDILTNQLEGGCEIHVIARDGGIQHLSIYSRGEVSYSFSDLVQSFAEQVGPLAKPGFITLRDYDSGDLENAIQTIWFGDPAEVVHARRIHAWQESTALLRDAGIAEEIISRMAAQGGFDSNVRNM